MTVSVSLRWVLTLMLVLAITAVSVVPGHSRQSASTFVWLIEITPSTLQKSMHFFVYAGLAWLWVWTLESVSPGWLRFALAFFLCAAISVGLEWYQTLVPGRFGTMSDVLLNTAGVIAGLLLARVSLTDAGF